MKTMTTNTAGRSLCSPCAPTYPLEALQARSIDAAHALADGRVADAADALDSIPHTAPIPWLGQIVAAVVLPDPAAWNAHDTNRRPVPAGMLVAVDLGEGRPLIDRAAVFDWGPGCGPSFEGRIQRWARIEGAGRPT